MNKRDRTEASKFLSFILRHRPDAIGLVLDREGWAAIDALLHGAAGAGHPLSREDLLEIVAGSDKQRFAISPDGRRIRAVQGHSTPAVAIDYPPALPPPVLFHGTAERFLSAIRRDGLLPGARQHVHLSPDAATARAVGGRHGRPVVLTIDAAGLHRDGAVFHRAENGVWLCAAVPVAYIGFPAEAAEPTA
ncbi:MAG: RNA 2'-phosphotransferase [Planctomycetes bacterium]|nr:RNA 2'-phosphotransferase [Planctomycetota bacterium]